MTSLLEIKELSVSFPISGGLLESLVPGRAKHLNVLDNVSMSLNVGETLGLVGESGSGKTTLARAILGLLPVSVGSIQFDGSELKSKQSFKAARRSSAMMFQDAISSLSPRMAIESLLIEPFIIHGVAVANRKIMIKDMLERVGLPADIANRYPHELSGGQARRVGVARALALNPKLIIADEPTAGLDVSVQGEILNLMTELKTQLGLSYVIITHNLAMVRHVSDRIAVMYLGRLVEMGPTRSIFAHPLHPYTKSLIASEPQPDPRKRRADLAIKGEIPSVLNRPKGCEFHTRCPLAQDICRTQAPTLKAINQNQFVRCHFAEN